MFQIEPNNDDIETFETVEIIQEKAFDVPLDEKYGGLTENTASNFGGDMTIGSGVDVPSFRHEEISGKNWHRKEPNRMFTRPGVDPNENMFKNKFQYFNLQGK